MSSKTPERILELLARKGAPEKASNIAHDLGFPSARNLNHFLYKLKRQGLLEQIRGTPPLWTINKKHQDDTMESTSAENDDTFDSAETADVDPAEHKSECLFDTQTLTDTVMTGAEDVAKVERTNQMEPQMDNNPPSTLQIQDNGGVHMVAEHPEAEEPFNMSDHILPPSVLEGSPKSKGLHDDAMFDQQQITKKMKLDLSPQDEPGTSGYPPMSDSGSGVLSGGAGNIVVGSRGAATWCPPAPPSMLLSHASGPDGSEFDENDSMGACNIHHIKPEMTENDSDNSSSMGDSVKTEQSSESQMAPGIYSLPPQGRNPFDYDDRMSGHSPGLKFQNVDGPTDNIVHSKASTAQAAPKNDLQQRILRFLKGSNGQKQPAQKIAHTMGFRGKKDINRDLYAMEKNGLIKKIQESPPIWQACSSPTQKTVIQSLNKVKHLQIRDDPPSMTHMNPQQNRPAAFNRDAATRGPFRAVNVPGFDLGNLGLQSKSSDINSENSSLGTPPPTGDLGMGRGRGIMMLAALRAAQSDLKPGMEPRTTGGNTAGFKIPANPAELLSSNTVFKNHGSSMANPSSFHFGVPNANKVPSLMSQTVYQRGMAPGSYAGNRINKSSNVAQHDIMPLEDAQYQGNSTSNIFGTSTPKPLAKSIFDSPDPEISSSEANLSNIDMIEDPQQKSLMSALTYPSPAQRTVNTSFSLHPKTTIPPTPGALLGVNPMMKPTLQSQSATSSAASGQSTTGGPVSVSADAFKALNKNSVSALMEYAQARKSTATIEVIGQRGPPHKPVFTLAVFIGKRKFPEVRCSNKKEGRTEAADIALRTLMAEGEYKVKQQADSVIMTLTGGNGTHFDRMAGLAHATFNKLAVHVAETMSGRKILAALIMQRGHGDIGSVISLGTGNRCITGNFMSLEGQTINDSHAEIITRRGLMRFLYRQAKNYVIGDPNCILEQGRGGLLKVKDNVTFHLYISTAPCGDGALFSPRDSHSAKMVCDDSRQAHQPIFSSKVQGVLRTKMEGGEGTIPIEAGFKCQTWDGILRGERLRTMSCSDKICRWNIVGMQGALLSHFLEPVYLDSLTLGLLYDHGHLSRAVCCRLSHGDPDLTEEMPHPYKINHPRLGRVTVCDPPRETQKTKEYSINWCEGDDRAEVLDGTKGIRVGVRTLDEQVSQVSKCALYEHFKSLCHQFKRQDLLDLQTYGAAKQKAAHFQQVKQLMMTKFKVRGYGPWVSKPAEEEMF